MTLTLPGTHAMLSALDRPTELAENLPRGAYTDPEFFRLELERVFGRNWTYVGAAGEIPKAGDAIPVTLGDMPIVLVRQRSGAVKAFHNVCRHRGPILVREPVKAQPALICPYHAWSYDLDGTLKRTPAYMGSGRHDSGPLDKSCMGLAEIRCDIWRDGIFINLSGDAGPLTEVYAPLEQRWASHDLSLLRYGGSTRLRINGNWKLAMENFQEGYHLPTTHPFLNSLSSLENHYSVVEPAFQGQGSHHYDTVQAGHGDLPNFPGLPDYWKHRAEYPAVMPNLMFGMHPDHFLFFGVIPLSPSVTEEVFHFYFIGDEALEPKYAALRERVISNLISINAEDIGVVESMQAGRHSPGFEKGPFSPYQEATIHQFQLKIAKMLDAPDRRA
jgi:choline monooxygenase